MAGPGSWLPEAGQSARQTLAVDVFSLGLVVFYCLTQGEHLWLGRGEGRQHLPRGLESLSGGAWRGGRLAATDCCGGLACTTNLLISPFFLLRTELPPAETPCTPAHPPIPATTCRASCAWAGWNHRP